MRIYNKNIEDKLKDLYIYALQEENKILCEYINNYIPQYFIKNNVMSNDTRNSNKYRNN